MKRRFIKKKDSALKLCSKREKVFLWILCAIFAIYVVSLLYPIYWTLINSVKTPRDFFSNFFGLPKEVVFSNYAEILNVEVNGTGVLAMYGNSFLVTIMGIGLCMIMSTLSAYTLAKYKFPGSRMIYNIAIILLMIPSTGNIPGTYKFLSSVGLYNTHFGVALLYCGAFGPPFLYLYNFYASVSWTYAEAAMMDGANDFQVFWQIMVPQSIGIVMALIVMNYPSVWGDYTNQMLYLKKYPTLTVGLKSLSDSLQFKGEWTISFAVVLLAGLPASLLSITLNRLMYNVKIDTGIKG